MAAPTIVPPPPTVTQSHGVDTSPGMDQVQKAFDQVLPAIRPEPKKTPPPSTPSEPTKPAETPTEPVKPAETPQQPTTQKPAEESHDVPSFLEEALRGDGKEVKPPLAAEPDEWPEELPEFKNSEEAKARYRKWRSSYDSQKQELKSLREKPTLNAQQLQRMEQLETENKQMGDVLTRLGVRQSAEFQQNVMNPLLTSWNEACHIVKNAGGDPQQLAKAMSLQGKAQFEALDELFSEMPESAKAEAHDALRNYRRYEQVRQQVEANAPAAMEGIRKREEARQAAELTRQRSDMAGMFDRVVQKMKADKLEVLLKTDSDDGKWWNDQGDRLVELGRNLFLENTDMEKVAAACLLAPAADTYRKLWLTSQKKIGQLQKIIREKIGNEPSLSESGGPSSIRMPEEQTAEDLKRPFAEVFLREFHKSQARSR